MAAAEENIRARLAVVRKRQDEQVARQHRAADPIAETMGVDALRYFLLREIVFGQDGSFSFDALVGRYNSDLANGLGNLASRTLSMIQQYRGGTIPESAADAAIAAVVEQAFESGTRRLRCFRVLSRSGAYLEHHLCRG